jgi:hypothetical protein
LIKPVNFVPDFLENLGSNNLLDALPRRVIRVEPLCEIAPERSVPEVTDFLTVTMITGFGRSFEQLRLCHQGADLPALALLVDRARSRAQALDLPYHLLILDEI